MIDEDDGMDDVFCDEFAEEVWLFEVFEEEEGFFAEDVGNEEKDELLRRISEETELFCAEEELALKLVFDVSFLPKKKKTVIINSKESAIATIVMVFLFIFSVSPFHSISV